MRTKETCQTCTIIKRNDQGQIEVTTDPDNKCEVRNTCHDDASTTERRRQIITPWPTIEIVTE